MAILPLFTRCRFLCTKISPQFNRFWSSVNNKNYCRNVLSQPINSNLICKTFIRNKSKACEPEQLSLSFEEDFMTQASITNEIHLYRDARNNFTEKNYTDTKQSYGPPLAILLPSSNVDQNVLKELIRVYGEKGFDVLMVYLNHKQIMFPCVAGGGMNIVTDLLEYLNDCQKHRPYIFHGFSIGVYTFGEIMAQFSDQFERYRPLTNNVKGCLWDSPVDVLVSKPCVGKFFYPKSWLARWRCNSAVNKHFKEHYHDSVAYWLRARDHFCNPVIRVPNVFFVSYTDPLSNPCSLQCVQKTLECNGIPIYQKSWWNSWHACHFQTYCYEYLYGLALFFNLSNLFPDEHGKYYSSTSNASLTNLRLSKRARDSFCEQEKTQEKV